MHDLSIRDLEGITALLDLLTLDAHSLAREGPWNATQEAAEVRRGTGLH